MTDTSTTVCVLLQRRRGMTTSNENWQAHKASRPDHATPNSARHHPKPTHKPVPRTRHSHTIRDIAGGPVKRPHILPPGRSQHVPSHRIFHTAVEVRQHDADLLQHPVYKLARRESAARRVSGPAAKRCQQAQRRLTHAAKGLDGKRNQFNTGVSSASIGSTLLPVTLCCRRTLSKPTPQPNKRPRARG